MTNRLFPKAREAFLKGELSWRLDTYRVVLVHFEDPFESIDFATVEYLDDIPPDNRIHGDPDGDLDTWHGDLNDFSMITDGVANIDDHVMNMVAGDEVHAIVIYKYTGNPLTDLLVYYIDQHGNLPFTPNGGDVTIIWDNGPYKVFKL